MLFPKYMFFLNMFNKIVCFCQLYFYNIYILVDLKH